VCYNKVRYRPKKKMKEEDQRVERNANMRFAGLLNDIKRKKKVRGVSMGIACCKTKQSETN
jgi:hypothetical protein